MNSIYIYLLLIAYLLCKINTIELYRYSYLSRGNTTLTNETLSQNFTDEVTFEITSTTKLATTTIPVSLRPILSFQLNFSVNCSNCTEFLCNNKSLISLKESLSSFYETKFLKKFEIFIRNKENSIKKDLVQLNQDRYDLVYQIKFRPISTDEIESIKNDFYNNTNSLVLNSTIWNLEYESYAFNNFISDLIQVDFASAIPSFKQSYLKLEYSKNKCSILSCSSDFYVPICDNKQEANLQCKHKCDAGGYCKNRGQCIKSINNEPKCLCSYAIHRDWGMNVHYSGAHCEILHQTISRSLFILIVTIISSVLVLAIILASLKFHILKKKSGNLKIIHA